MFRNNPGSFLGHNKRKRTTRFRRSSDSRILIANYDPSKRVNNRQLDPHLGKYNGLREG
jgi:hypothetical protein